MTVVNEVQPMNYAQILEDLLAAQRDLDAKREHIAKAIEAVKPLAFGMIGSNTSLMFAGLDTRDAVRAYLMRRTEFATPHEIQLGLRAGGLSEAATEYQRIYTALRYGKEFTYANGRWGVAQREAVRQPGVAARVG